MRKTHSEPEGCFTAGQREEHVGGLPGPKWTGTENVPYLLSVDKLNMNSLYPIPVQVGWNHILHKARF